MLSKEQSNSLKEGSKRVLASANVRGLIEHKEAMGLTTTK